MKVNSRFRFLMMLVACLATVVALVGGNLPVTRAAAPDIALAFDSATQTATFIATQNGTYVLELTNPGDALVANGTLVISGNAPSNSAIVSVTPNVANTVSFNCTSTANNFSCTNTADVPAFLSTPQKFSIVVNFGANAPTPIQFSVTAPVAGDSNPTSNTATTTNNVQGVLNLSVQFSRSGPLFVNVPVTYTVTVINNGAGSSSGPLFLNFDISGMAGTPGFANGGGAGWSCGTTFAQGCQYNSNISPNSTLPVVTFQATPSTAGAWNLKFSAAARGNSSAVVSDVATVAVPPDLRITKTVAPNYTNRQAAQTYTLTVDNVGGGPTVGNITVTDTLVAGLRPLSATGPNFSCSVTGQTLTCIRAAANQIPAAGNAQIVVTLTDLKVPGVYAATSSGSGATVATPNDGNTANDNSNNQGGSGTTVLGADLAIGITRTGPLGVLASNTTYTMTVTNVSNSTFGNGLGTSAPAGATVVATLPAELQFGGPATTITGSGGFTCGAPVGQTLTCTSGSPLNPGQSAAIKFGVQAASSSIGATNVTTTATVDSILDPLSPAPPPAGDPTPPVTSANNTASDIFAGPIPTPDLVLDATAVQSPSPCVAGSNCNFTFKLSQASDSASEATGGNPIKVEITLPNNVSANPISGAGQTTVTGGDATFTCVYSDVAKKITCTATAGFLRKGNPATFSTNVFAPPQTTPFTVNAKAFGGNDPFPADLNTAGDNKDYTINVGSADLVITKSAVGTFQIGSTGIFSFTVTNNGNTATTNPAIVADTLPASVFYDGANTTVADLAGWTCAGLSNVSCQFTNPIAAGASKTFQFRVFLDTTLMGPPVVASIQNSATVSMLGEVNTGNNTSNTITVNLTPQPVPTIVATNSCAPTAQAIGSSTSTICTLKLQNTGTADATIPSGAFTLTTTFQSPGLVGNGFSPSAAVGPWTGTYNGANFTVTWVNSAGAVSIPKGTTLAQDFILQVLPGTTTGSFKISGTAAWASAPAGVNVTNPADVFISVGAAPQSDLSITILPANKNAVGNTTDSYTIRVTNSSVANFSATAFSVTTNFTGPVSATGATGTGWTCSTSAPNVTCNRTGGGPFTLAPNTSFEDITVNVNIATVASTQNTSQGASLSNITPASADSNPNNNNATQTTIVTTGPQPDLTVTEANPPTFTINVANSFSITVNNVGTAATANDITVTKPMPPGFTVNPGNAGGFFNCVQQNTPSVAAVCTRTSANPLAAGASATITLSVTPSQSGTFPNTQDTVALASPGTESNTNNNTFTNPNQVVVNGIPTLTISKTEQPAGNFVLSAGTGVYRVTITNTGGAATTGTITITDTLPGSAMSYNSATPVTGGLTISCGGSPTVTCTTSYSIAAGGTAVFDLTVNLLTTGTFTNNISVTGGGFAGTATGSKSTTIDAAPTPNLTISKVGPSTMQVNTPNSFSITVTNTTSVTTSGTMTVTDTLDGKLQFTSGSGTGFTCSAAGNLVTCTGSPALTLSQSVTLTINVLPIAPGTISNTATVSGGGMTTPKTSTPINVTINAGPPNLTINKTANGTLTANQVGSFSITVSNAATAGPSTGTITVTDTLPSGFRFVSASGGGFVCTGIVNTNSLVTCTRDGTLPINGGEVATITLSVNPDPTIYVGTTPFIVTNNASLTGGGVVGTLTASAQASVIPLNPQAPASTSTATYNIVPTTAPADNTTLVTLTITISRINGSVAALDTTVTLLPSPSTGLTITPATSQVTNASGQVVFQIKSTTAGVYTFGITASNPYGSATYTTNPPTVTFTGGTAGTTSATNSTVVTDYTSIPADGTTKATITVTLKDASNNLVANKPVTLSVSPSSTTIQITPSTTVTSGTDGRAVFSVAATAQQGPNTFSASVTDGSIIFLNQTVQITFTAPGTKPIAATAVPGATAAATQPSIIAIPTGPIVGRVVAWRLRVRTGPGLTFPIIGLLQFGTDVTIVARNERGTWYLIQLQTGTAWVSAAWVRVTRSGFRQLPVTQSESGTAPLVPVPSPLIPTTGQGIGRVNTFLLRVRTGPGTGYQQIGVLQEGTEILLLGVSQGGAWYKFKTQAGEAWVSASFVKVVRLVGNRLPTVDAPPLP